MSRFDQKLAAGEGVVGTFSHLGGPAVAECLSLSGLDYVIIDTEHGPFPDESTGEMIRAIELHSAEAFVRVRDSSRAAVLHALDVADRLSWSCQGRAFSTLVPNFFFRSLLSSL